MLWMIIVGALVGRLIAEPTVRWARHLLARVPAAEAAPVALSAPVGGMASVAGEPATLAPVLAHPWPSLLRWGLGLAVPLTLWRGGVGAHHLAAPLAALALAACVVPLVLAAALDGAAHLIFAEVIALPAAVALIAAAGDGAGVWPGTLLGGAVGGGAMLLLYLAGQMIYGTDALGWGDVQLGLALGLVLGVGGIMRALLGGMLLLVVVTLALLALRRITTRSFVPLGSYLILGALASLLCVPPPWL